MGYTETQREMIKSFAYGYSAKQISEHYGITEEEAENLKKEAAGEIEEKSRYLKEQGWM